MLPDAGSRTTHSPTKKRIVNLSPLLRAGLLGTLCLVHGAALAQSLDASVDPVASTPAARSLLHDQRAAQPERVSRTAGGLAPFGARLFDGGFAADGDSGLNPGYRLQSGDRVAVRIWGATEFDEVLPIDPQGNIFLPRVGPIALAGVRNADLNDTVSAKVATVFTDNVRVYTSLLGAQPVAVFVTGDVLNPGRFGGVPSSSVLNFLDRAGGIHPERGSYRDVRVLRDGRELLRLDVYDFLAEGQLPAVQFRDGDTILVTPRGSSVVVEGDVSVPARFEMRGERLFGQQLLDLARPVPGASHVAVSGVRDGQPFSLYLPMAEFRDFALAEGDTASVRRDTHDDVIVVEVEGAHEGPSRFAVPRDTRLKELLDHIEIDPALAAIDAISLRRESIVVRQRAALQDSLRRLEAQYLTAASQTDAESAIRAQEADLIGRFVQNAAQVEPNGRLVLARNGDLADIRLQSGDTISIPSTSDSVLLSGEVMVSQAILHERGLTARDYIDRSGGFSRRADDKQLIVVRANGEVISGKNPTVRAGDEIIVLPKVPVKNLQIAATIVDILYKIAIATSVAVSL